MQETIREELNGSKSRYEKGLELFKEGKVFFSKGMYQVNGYTVDLRSPVKCECPDFRVRKQSCKHIFAALSFAKGNGNGSSTKPEIKPGNGFNKPYKAKFQDSSRQNTITRLAVINSAIELLKTHRKPIEIQEVISLASQLETWALGK